MPEKQNEKQNGVKLKRVLTLKYLIAFGLAYLAPTVVFNYYGIITQLSGGMMSTVYLITLIVLLFTAYSYTRMVKAFPISGSAYTYVQRSMHPNVGFLGGWVMLLDYMLIPMICYLLIGFYMNEYFPDIPVWVWVVIVLILGAVINIIGVKTVAVVDTVIVVAQLLFTAVFVVLCIKFVADGGDGSGHFIMVSAIFNPDTFVPTDMMWAGSILACSFLGFDAVSTLAEETKDPAKTVSKAIIIIVVGAGLIFAIVSYFAQIAWPAAYSEIEDPDTGIFELLPRIGGSVLSTVFLVVDNFASFVCALAGIASVTRILFSMGRDGILPGKVFGHLSKRFQTPVYNILITSVVALSAVLYSDNLLGAASLVSFGALIGFALVNCSVISHYFIRGKRREGADIIMYLILPLIGALLCIALWFTIDSSAKILGSIWLFVGIVVLCIMTKGFSIKPKEIDLSEE